MAHLQAGTSEETQAALKAAAAGAGLEIQQFILEPVAAALAYEVGVRPLPCCAYADLLPHTSAG
jgi:hypothetical protein